jgi:Domain of unknown function (DUF4440)
MSRKLPLATVMILCFASLVLAQEVTPAPSPAPKPAMSKAQSQKLIISTERKLWEAWKNHDMKPFKAYLSSDSVMIGESGVRDKTAEIKELGIMACEIKSYELSDIKVLFLGSDAAVVTYKAMQDGTCGGEAVPPAVWASSAYVRRGGKWLAASHQETAAK